jgi:hypothetical protein
MCRHQRSFASCQVTKTGRVIFLIDAWPWIFASMTSSPPSTSTTPLRASSPDQGFTGVVKSKWLSNKGEFCILMWDLCCQERVIEQPVGDFAGIDKIMPLVNLTRTLKIIAGFVAEGNVAESFPYIAHVP